MDLSDINMISGVNEKGEPFVTISAISADGRIMIGQLSPDEVRKHGYSYLEVAEAADQDAAIFRVVRDLGLPVEVTGLIVTELRKRRKD